MCPIVKSGFQDLKAGVYYDTGSTIPASHKRLQEFIKLGLVTEEGLADGTDDPKNQKGATGNK